MIDFYRPFVDSGLDVGVTESLLHPPFSVQEDVCVLH